MTVAWVIMFVFGALFVAGSALNWTWVFELSRLRWITYIFGEKAARIVYGILGACFLVVGAMNILESQKTEAKERSRPGIRG